MTKEEIESLPDLYKSGMSTYQIARKYGSYQSTVYRYLKRTGNITRDLSEAKRRHKCNHGAFDVLSPDAKYWVGFLFADGCIVRNAGGSDTLQLKLAKKDESHVIKLRSFLESNHNIHTSFHACYGGTSADLAIRSNPLTNRLRSLGLLGKLNHEVAEELAFDSDFWRGVIDGDGHVKLTYQSASRKSYPVLNLCGGWKLLEQYRRFVSSVAPRYRGNITPHSTIYQVRLMGSIAYDMVRFLYSDPSTYLDRKYEAASRIMQEYERPLHIVPCPESRPIS